MECQLSVVKAREGTRELMPGDGLQDGVMSPARINEVHLTVVYLKGSLSLDKMTVESRGIALFKTAQMPG